MKTLLIAAAIAATSLTALAGRATYEYPQPAQSHITRAQVVSQLKSAGPLVSGERSYVAPQTGPALSRAEVPAALDLAQRRGQLAHGEFSFNADTGGTTGTRIAEQ